MRVQVQSSGLFRAFTSNYISLYFIFSIATYYLAYQAFIAWCDGPTAICPVNLNFLAG